jgi:hypothetical protein
MGFIFLAKRTFEMLLKSKISEFLNHLRILNIISEILDLYLKEKCKKGQPKWNLNYHNAYYSIML